MRRVHFRTPKLAAQETNTGESVLIAVTRARRRWLALGLCAFSTWAAAQAPAAPVPISALGVYALLGDEVQVTVADAPAASRIERSARQSFVVKSIGFDNIVLRSVRDTAERDMPGMALQMFRANTVMPAAEQRSIAAGARSGALPDWIVQTIAQHRLSHVLQLTLMDTQSGQVVRSYTVNDQSLVSPRTYGSESDPWGYLSPQEKVEVLRKSLQSSLARVMPGFLAGR